MQKLIAIVGMVLALGACSKPRTEAPMQRPTPIQRSATQESSKETQTAARAEPVAYSYSIIEHATPLEMFADSVVTLLVKVKNTSDRAWSVGSPVKLGFYWTDEKDKRLPEGEGRAVLRKDASPGAAVFFRCRVKAPGAPGKYRLVWDMIEEKVAWFESKGVKPLRVPVTVR